MKSVKLKHKRTAIKKTQLMNDQITSYKNLGGKYAFKKIIKGQAKNEKRPNNSSTNTDTNPFSRIYIDTKDTRLKLHIAHIPKIRHTALEGNHYQVSIANKLLILSQNFLTMVPLSSHYSTIGQIYMQCCNLMLSWG